MLFWSWRPSVALSQEDPGTPPLRTRYGSAAKTSARFDMVRNGSGPSLGGRGKYSFQQT